MVSFSAALKKLFAGPFLWCYFWVSVWLSYQAFPHNFFSASASCFLALTRWNLWTFQQEIRFLWIQPLKMNLILLNSCLFFFSFCGVCWSARMFLTWKRTLSVFANLVKQGVHVGCDNLLTQKRMRFILNPQEKLINVNRGNDTQFLFWPWLS